MRLRSRIVIIAGTVATLGWAYSHLRDDQVRSRREIERMNTTLAQLQQQSGRPTAGTDGERRAIDRASQVARAEARDQALAALAEHDRGGEVRAQQAPSITFEESQQRVRSVFAAEAVDASWGPEAERTLERIVRSHLPSGSRLNGVACRSSMCEVQLIHPDPKTQADFLRAGFRGWPGSLFVTEETQEQGEVAITIIAAREGTEPPIAPR